MNTNIGSFVGLQLLNGQKAFGILREIDAGKIVILTNDKDIIKFSKNTIRRLLLVVPGKTETRKNYG